MELDNNMELDGNMKLDVNKGASGSSPEASVVDNNAVEAGTSAETGKPDKHTVPYERLQEVVQREKQSDERYQQQIADLKAAHEAELGRMSETPAHDDADIDEATGLTYGNLKALDARIQGAQDKKVGQIKAETHKLLANNHIDQQVLQLRQNPAYKDFFEMPEYVTEMKNKLSSLDPETSFIPNIVAQAADMTIGNHIGDYTKKIESRLRKSISEERTIAGEIQLGKSAGVVPGTKIPVTNAIRSLARDGEMSLEDAAEVLSARKAAQAKFQKEA